jgi:hypothetical protein
MGVVRDLNKRSDGEPEAHARFSLTLSRGRNTMVPVEPTARRLTQKSVVMRESLGLAAGHVSADGRGVADNDLK